MSHQLVVGLAQHGGHLCTGRRALDSAAVLGIVARFVPGLLLGLLLEEEFAPRLLLLGLLLELQRAHEGEPTTLQKLVDHNHDHVRTRHRAVDERARRKRVRLLNHRVEVDADDADALEAVDILDRVDDEPSVGVGVDHDSRGLTRVDQPIAPPRVGSEERRRQLVAKVRRVLIVGDDDGDAVVEV